MYSRVPNKQTGRLLENEKNPTYTHFLELNVYQFSINCPTYSVMAIRVVEFSNGGYKVRKIFA